MNNHSVLAPSWRDAQRLTAALDHLGFTARHTRYGRHHVVLAIAPRNAVTRLCHWLGGKS